MTDELRDLFAQAVLDEPDRIVSPDEDIARGRARRAKRRRGRLTAGVVGVLAAGSLGLVAPDAIDELRPPAVEAAPAYDELPPFEPTALAAQLTSFHGGAYEGNAESSEPGAQSGLLASGTEPAAMLPAVRAALPAGVTLADDEDGQQVGRHRMVLAAERDGERFTLRVWWQPSTAVEFRPCTEPAAAFTRTAAWDDCTEGYDEQRRWRVAGTPDPRHRVLAVDGETVVVTLAWETADDSTAPGSLLSDDEADRIADAAWAVAAGQVPQPARSSGQDLGSDFEIGAVAAAWTNVEAGLTRILGPLTRIWMAQPDPARPADWAAGPQVITASYRTAHGGTVELAVWAAGPMYSALCTNLLACDVWEGSRDYFRPLLEPPADARGGTAFGDLGHAYLVLDGIDGDAAALHRAGMEAIFAVLPNPG